MRSIGNIVRVTQRLYIVQCDGPDHPSMGTALVDETLSTIGAVVDVFGPVDGPYLAVDPTASVQTGFIGRRLYAR